MADEVTPTENSAATETTQPNDAPATTETTALGDASTGEEADDTSAEGDNAAKTDEQSAEAGEEAAKTEVPESYELTFSDGFVGDPATLEAATPILKEIGLTNDQAQMLVPLLEQHTTRILEARDQAQAELISAERANWLTQAKADAEIGGDKWDKSLMLAAKALDTLGATKGSPFRDLLDATGLGNHPEAIRIFAKAGAALSEDSDFPRGGASPGPRTAAQILYGPKE